MDLIKHYQRLLLFGLHLWEGDNVKKMREYYSHIVIDEIQDFGSFQDAKILDVGGATGTFVRVFQKKLGGTAINIDPRPQSPYRTTSDEYIITKTREMWPDTVVGIGEKLPFKDDQFDAVFCRSVLEHISKEQTQRAVDEIYRVTKEGGLCYIAVPPWYSPWGGHQLKPFHILPFKLAKKLRLFFFKSTRINPNSQSLADISLFPITFKQMLLMLNKSGFTVRTVKDTHFRLHFLAKIPLIREVAIPLAAFIAEK